MAQEKRKLNDREFWEKEWKEKPENGRSTYTQWVAPDVSGKWVLEVGPGDAFYSSLPGDAAVYTAIDLSRTALTCVLRNNPRGLFVQGSVACLPFTSDFFDASVMVSTAPLLGREFPRALGEVARVTAPSGTVSFNMSHVDILNSVPDEELQFGSIFTYRFREVIAMKEEQVEPLLASVGLKLDQMQVFKNEDWTNLGAPFYQRISVPNPDVKAEIVVYASKIAKAS